nr:MAG TPA: hypothetical protein [Caudoviricetes sp.]
MGDAGGTVTLPQFMTTQTLEEEERMRGVLRRAFHH